MPTNNYSIFQGQILDKDPVNPRQYTVIQIPEGFTLTQVQLPNALKDQSMPLIGSIVLVLQLADYSAYILSILREPFEFLTANNQFRGFIPSTGNLSQDISIGSNPIQDGEIYMEATGPTSPTGQGIPGFGAHLYLGNNGSAQIESGSTSERLVIGGTSSDEDHEVLLSADNGFIESNTNEITQIVSTFNWDDTNSLQLGNVIANPATDVTIPVSELTMDTLGSIVLRNTTSGVDKSFLKLDTTSDISLGNTLSTLQMDLAGNISMTGTTIDLNNGTNPAARVNDSIFSSLTQDPAFWQFIQTLFLTFNLHTHTSATPGSPTSPPLTPLVTFPTQLSGIVSTGSSTVKIGG